MNTGFIRDTLHKRVPFKYVGDDNLAGNDTRILDDEEQEEVINNLRKADVRSRKLNALLARVVIGLSFALHLIYILGGNNVDPVTNLDLFPAPFQTRPLPLASPFTLFHLLLHVNLAQRFIPARFTIRTWLLSNSQQAFAVWFPLSYRLTAASAAVAPVLSLITARGISITVWWSVTEFVIGISWLIEHWDLEGEEHIRELEGLKYVARGA